MERRRRQSGDYSNLSHGFVVVGRSSRSPATSLASSTALHFDKKKSEHYFFCLNFFLLPPKHINIYIFIRICANINFCIFFQFFSSLSSRWDLFDNFWLSFSFSLHSFLQNRRKKCTNLLWRLNLNTKTTYQVTFGTARHFSRSFLFYYIIFCMWKFERSSSSIFLFSLLSHSCYPRC